MARLPVIDDPAITEALLALEEDDDPPPAVAGRDAGDVLDAAMELHDKVCFAMVSEGECDALADSECAAYMDIVPAIQQAIAAERDRLLNTPVLHEFAEGVTLEALHQRNRWTAEADAGKTPLDWFWLIGYLAQKVVVALDKGDVDKALHHTISTAAVLANWHDHIESPGKFRPGISAEKQAEGDAPAYPEGDRPVDREVKG